MKYKVLKTLILGDGQGGKNTHQAGDIVDSFMNDKLMMDLGFIALIEGRDVPTTPIAAEKPPAPPDEPAEDAESTDELIPEEATKAGFTREELESMYKKDLRDLAKNHELDAELGKADLIEAILKVQA